MRQLLQHLSRLCHQGHPHQSSLLRLRLLRQWLRRLPRLSQRHKLLRVRMRRLPRFQTRRLRRSRQALLLDRRRLALSNRGQLELLRSRLRRRWRRRLLLRQMCRSNPSLQVAQRLLQLRRGLLRLRLQLRLLQTL